MTGKSRSIQLSGAVVPTFASVNMALTEDKNKKFGRIFFPLLFFFLLVLPCKTASASDYRLYNCQFPVEGIGAALMKEADLDGTSVYLPGYWSINKIDYRDGDNWHTTCQDGWYGPGPVGSDFWKDLQEFASTHEDGGYLAYGAADGSYLFLSVSDHSLI